MSTSTRKYRSTPPPPPCPPRRPKRRKITVVTNRYCCSCSNPAGAFDVECLHCAHRLCEVCDVVNGEIVDLDPLNANTEQGSHEDYDNCTTQKTQQHPIPTQRRSQLSNDQQSDDLTVETIREYGTVQESGARQTRNLEETRVLSTERQCAPLVIQEVKKRKLNMVKCENCRRDKKRVMNPPYPRLCSSISLLTYASVSG
jgi:hypothetical protein